MSELLNKLARLLNGRKTLIGLVLAVLMGAASFAKVKWGAVILAPEVEAALSWLAAAFIGGGVAHKAVKVHQLLAQLIAIWDEALKLAQDQQEETAAGQPRVGGRFVKAPEGTRVLPAASLAGLLTGGLVETALKALVKGLINAEQVKSAPKGTAFTAQKVYVLRAFGRRADVDLVLRLADEPKE